jgi:hypothetical protein
MLPKGTQYANRKTRRAIDMRAVMVLLMLGLSYALAILATSCVIAVYLAFQGNFGGLIGLAIDAGLCLICAEIYHNKLT